MSLPIRIYRVQTDGALQFVEGIQTFDGARERVRELGKLCSGEYIIDNEGTGERVFVSTRDEKEELTAMDRISVFAERPVPQAGLQCDRATFPRHRLLARQPLCRESW
jgi:hypothetical protein